MTIEQWSASNLSYLAILTWINFVIALTYSCLVTFNILALLIRWHNGNCSYNIKCGKAVSLVVTLWSIFAILNYFLNILNY